MQNLSFLPRAHRSFVERSLPILQRHPLIDGVAAAGSWISRNMDEYSDLDFVIAARDENFPGLLAARQEIAESLGALLASFQGDHVGEPRLLICLYENPFLHVDLKVVSLSDFEKRIEDPVVLWEREASMTEKIASFPSKHPMPDLQRIEDRFWIWIHYAALRLGRGELFEVIDFLGFLRGHVFGPLILAKAGHLPRGVRRLEVLAPGEIRPLQETIAVHDASSCRSAIHACVALYRRLRQEMPDPGLIRRKEAEEKSVAFLERV